MREVEHAVEALTPWLESLEAQRRSAVRRFLIGGSASVAVAVLGTLGLVLFVLPLPFFFVGGILLAAGGLALAGRPLADRPGPGLGEESNTNIWYILENPCIGMPLDPCLEPYEAYLAKTLFGNIF